MEIRPHHPKDMKKARKPQMKNNNAWECQKQFNTFNFPIKTKYIYIYLYGH